MKKKNQHGAHDNEERWLLTYADLITLLLGLFVILYAMSKIDAGKYAEIVNAMEGVFGSPKGVMAGSMGIVEPPVNVLQRERQRIVEEIQSALQAAMKDNMISVSENERGITVHIMEEMLYPSGSADLKNTSLTTLDSLAGVLRMLPNDIRVEGHTDDVPIRSPNFPSNWHLSVARAVNIGYYLIERHGLTASKVSVVGYAEYRPLVPNDTPENRARNRRVDIVIVTNTNHFNSDSQQKRSEADSSGKENG
jgi:chemotaxis protein MotB